eukprot:4886089-Prymnesium_polylepis.1
MASANHTPSDRNSACASTAASTIPISRKFCRCQTTPPMRPTPASHWKLKPMSACTRPKKPSGA